MLDSYFPLARRMLEHSELTRQVSSATLEHLLGACTIQRHAAGQTLSRRGEPLGELLFLLEGSLEVSMDGSDGRRSICWYLGPGQWMGLIPILDGKAAIHNLRAHQAVVLLHLPRADLLAAMQADPHLARMCIAVLCERSRAIYDNLAAESLLPLRARVARLLLMLVDQHGRDGLRGIEIALKLSQDEFADMLGVTRQSLNRELKALEKQHIISIAYSRITLRNLPLLHQVASADAHATPLETLPPADG